MGSALGGGLLEEAYHHYRQPSVPDEGSGGDPLRHRRNVIDE